MESQCLYECAAFLCTKWYASQFIYAVETVGVSYLQIFI